jgi:hypothetical protein
MLSVGCFLPVPAHAGGIGTAAWSTARSVCWALGNGLTISEAVRVGMSDNQYLWTEEMREPVFGRLMAAEAARMCPEDLIRAYQGRGQQL